MKRKETEVSFLLKTVLQKQIFKALFVIMTGLVMLVACEDFFEKDLSDKKVTLIAPGDSLLTDNSTQTFYWQEVEGALTYNLQVVTPSFQKIAQIVVDTTVTGYKFTMNLTPGKYQWRVIALNGSSRTDSFVIRSLQIDTSSDLRNVKVMLKDPANGIATNSRKITFKWENIYNATGYRLQAGTPDLNGTLVLDTTVTTVSTPVNFSWPDGNYTWGVKAFNGNTNTSFSTRTVFIDRTVPAIPSPSAPKDKDQLASLTVNLQWSRSASDGGSSLADSIYVSVDSVSIAQLNYGRIDKYSSATMSQSVTFPSDSTYFWRVRTYDAAGNRSAPSDMRKFRIVTH